MQRPLMAPALTMTVKSSKKADGGKVACFRRSNDVLWRTPTVEGDALRIRYNDLKIAWYLSVDTR